MFVSIKECSKDRVPSFCPSLTLKETRAVLDRFPQLGCVKTWIWRRRNPYYAASGIVLASGGPVFIKRHSSSVRNAHALMQEHRFIAHLRAAQLPVCEVRKCAIKRCSCIKACALRTEEEWRLINTGPPDARTIAEAAEYGLRLRQIQVLTQSNWGNRSSTARVSFSVSDGQKEGTRSLEHSLIDTNMFLFQQEIYGL